MSASQPRLSRRSALRLLGAALLATVAGCRPSKQSDGARQSSSATGSTAQGPPAARVAPSRALAARVANHERQLIDAYDAAIAAQPDLRSTLEPLRADHAAHLIGLTPGAATTPAGSAPAGATRSSAPPASATPTPPAANPSDTTPTAANPSDGAADSPAQSARSLRAETLATLATRERAAAAARVDDVMSADDGSLARLLASIGGCEAAHAALLSAAS